MNRQQLITEGICLATDLVAASEQHSSLSDWHQILGYESAAIEAYVRFLSDGTPVADNLKESILLGKWGQGYAGERTDLRQRAAAFYAALQEHLSGPSDERSQ